MPMKLTTTTKGEKRKRKKIRKNLQNKSKHNNKFKKFKKERKRKKKKENSTELQKPNIEVEVYNNNKNVTEKKKKFKSLIIFNCATKISKYNRGGKNGKEKKEIQKNLQNKSKHRKNKCFSRVPAARVLSFPGSHSPPHLARMASNTMLISGPAVGAAQILIWSYSCVFLSPMSTAIRTSVFSFVGALNDLLCIP